MGGEKGMAAGGETSEFDPGSFLQTEMITDTISKGAGRTETLPDFSGRWSLWLSFVL